MEGVRFKKEVLLVFFFKKGIFEIYILTKERINYQHWSVQLGQHWSVQLGLSAVLQEGG